MIDDLVPQEYDDAEPGWAPRGEHDAEMALRGLERMAAKFAAVQQQAVAYRADIDAWEQAEIARLRGRATNLVLGLQSWARDKRILSKHKDKSFRFPSGEIATKAARSKAQIEDEAALLKWCEENVPDAVKVTKSVLVSVLQKAEGVEMQPGAGVRRLMLHGEPVPGVHVVVPGPAQFSVEVKLASQRALPAGSSD